MYILTAEIILVKFMKFIMAELVKIMMVLQLKISLLKLITQ